jgi:signal transduction histidine kinase
MLPSSHGIPIVGPSAESLSDRTGLAGAFSEFIAAAGCLERSYHDLHLEVVHLRKELEERNSALNSSVAENERTRLALQRIVGALPCGVLVFEANGAITLMNAEAKHLLDLEAAGACNLNELPTYLKPHLEELLKCNPDYDREAELCVSTNSAKRWIAARSRCLFVNVSGSQSAEARQTVLTLREVTAQKELEQEREAARNRLALAEMSAVLAHEIRNPLASMELFADLIAEEQPGAAERISQIQAGIRTLSATVNNVLSFHNAAQSRMSPIVVGPILKNCVEFVRPIARQAGIAVVLRGDTCGVRIAGDENALQQVMLNLACNAIHNMPGGGRLSISVRTKRAGETVYASIRMTDVGRGIQPQHLAHIFEPGFSASGSTPGLGLAVCKRIVEQHRGSIRVRSRVDRGTTFILEFLAL